MGEIAFFSFPDIVFINEEPTGCINKKDLDAIIEVTVGAIRAPRNPPSCFFISSFNVSVTPSISWPGFSSDSTILIVPFVSSSANDKLNPFPAYTTPFAVVFLSNLSTANEVDLVASLGKTFLAKGTVRSNNNFYLNWPFTKKSTWQNQN